MTNTINGKLTTGSEVITGTDMALDARVGPGASKETVAQLLQANVPGLVVNAGAYSTTTAMAMFAQESDLNKTMVDVMGLATAGMPYFAW